MYENELVPVAFINGSSVCVSVCVWMNTDKQEGVKHCNALNLICVFLHTLVDTNDSWVFQKNSGSSASHLHESG